MNPPARLLALLLLLLAWPGLAAESTAPDPVRLIRQGEAALAEGRTAAAQDLLEQALAQARQAQDPRLTAAAAGALGQALARRGDAAGARRQLEAAIAACPACADIAAVSHDNLGNLLLEAGDAPAALAQHEAALDLADSRRGAGDRVVTARVRVNAARAAQAAGRVDAARRHLAEAEAALAALAALPADADQARLLLAVGRLRLTEPGADPGAARLAAHRLYRQAEALAVAAGDARGQSLALGYLAELYAREGRAAEERRLLRDALLAAQRARATDLEYRWQWRLGRRLKADGDADGALAAYRAAVRALQAVAPDLLGTPGAFRDQVKPIFLELVDLLFEHSERAPEAARPGLLAEAREVIEGYRAAELQDYFADDCVADARRRAGALERLAPRTAVLYPILLPDRVELLLSTDAGLRRATSRVDAAALDREVDALRAGLQGLVGLDYLEPARRLHDWLIRPLAAWLEADRVDTLVIVPDGALRTIPLAALHDGAGFLLAHYAVVTTPGLSLTDPRPFRERGGAALVAGLSEAVQGFPALPDVPDELDAIAALYPGTRLQDGGFVADNLRRELAAQPYSLVHVATHARFERQARDSFLLTYDARLSLGELGGLLAATQGREQGVELLSLSACETAVGDDRAALGLAGVAVKAGARSALATLWRVSDEATARLLPEFYRQLADPAVPGKAQALRRAQLKLLRGWQFRHPGYWAPFLLIGNWL